MDDLTRLLDDLSLKPALDDLSLKPALDDLSLSSTKEKTETKSNKINETELYQKYKATYSAAFADLGQHALFLWGAFYALYLYKDSYMTLFTIPFASLMLNRTFIVFHDCQHGSYTPSPIVNYIISHITGTFVLTSPNWILDHHTHHLTNGNIDNEYNYKFNELIDYTKSEYLSFTRYEKVCFYIFYNRYTYFSIFPIIYFYIAQRFIYIIKKIKYGEKIKKQLSYILFDHVLNNINIIVFFYVLYINKIWIHYLISSYINFILGFFLFHNQHTFNPPYVKKNDEWTQKNSGIHGSSFIQVPFWLRYFYMGIEYHHIHHMNPKIPGYHIKQYHEEVIKQSDLFDPVIKLSLWDCYQNLWFVLYDEDTKKYIRFDELDYNDRVTWNDFIMNDLFSLSFIIIKYSIILYICYMTKTKIYE